MLDPDEITKAVASLRRLIAVLETTTVLSEPEQVAGLRGAADALEALIRKPS